MVLGDNDSYVWKMIKKISWKMFLFSGLADFMLLILGGFLYNTFFFKFFEKLYKFSLLATSGQYTVEDIVKNTTARSIDMVLETQALRNDLMNLLFLFLLLMYIVYCATQSLSWYFVKRYSKEKIRFLPYAGDFFKNNLLLFFGIILIAYFAAKAIFNPFVAITPENVQKIILAIAGILTILLFFIMPPVYVKVKLKQTLKFSILNFGKLFILYVQSFIILLVAYLIVVEAAKIHWLVSFILGLVLFLPLLTAVKYYLNKNINKL